jgi:uncharacterized protein YbjQ (UPF0145 family)
MIISTTPTIAGHRVVETKGEVFGLIVRSRGVAGNLMAGLRTIMGGEITEYTHLIEESRGQAVERMTANAAALGANAIVSMRFDGGSIGEAMSEIVAYGTAVVIAPGDGGCACGCAE